MELTFVAHSQIEFKFETSHILKDNFSSERVKFDEALTQTLRIH